MFERTLARCPIVPVFSLNVSAQTSRPEVVVLPDFKVGTEELSLPTTPTHSDFIINLAKLPEELTRRCSGALWMIAKPGNEEAKSNLSL